MNEPKKPTLDERLEALTRNVEIMHLDMETFRERQKLFDRRERRAREALLAAISTYLQAIKGADE